MSNVPRQDSDPTPVYAVDLVARGDAARLEKAVEKMASAESVEELERRMGKVEENISEVKRNTGHMEISWRESARNVDKTVLALDNRITEISVPVRWIERFSFFAATGILGMLGIAIWKLVIAPAPPPPPPPAPVIYVVPPGAVPPGGPGSPLRLLPGP